MGQEKIGQTTLPPETYQFALEHTADAVLITDMNSVIQYVNPAFTETTGFRREEAIGNKPNLLRSAHTTPATYRDMWKTILAGGWWRGEITNIRKNGQEWYSYLSISQIRDASGTPFAYIGISRDITQMKMLQLRLKEAGIEAIYMLSVASEAKDEITGSHIERVRHYSEALALRLGLGAQAAEEIGYSSMMHDIGKMHVPDVILKKPGFLSAEEWEVMREHPDRGVAILRDKPFYATARDIAGNHHERWDGSGYPSGKKGEEIPLASRIVSVADVFDALTTRRTYKPAWGDQEALDELRAQSGSSLDPRVVDAFLQLHKSGVVAGIRARFPQPAP